MTENTEIVCSHPGCFTPADYEVYSVKVGKTFTVCEKHVMDTDFRRDISMREGR